MPIELIKLLQETNRCKVPVQDNQTTHWLKIYRQEFVGGDIYWTTDDELALKLMPGWLPGQLQRVYQLGKAAK